MSANADVDSTWPVEDPWRSRVAEGAMKGMGLISVVASMLGLCCANVKPPAADASTDASAVST